MIFLAQVTHDTTSNTLESLWMQKTFADDGVTVVELKNVRRENYNAAQKDTFLTDCGEAGQKYVTMAGW